MTNIYLIYLLTVITAGFCLSVVVAYLNVASFSPVIPGGFEDVFDEQQYAKSQEYFKHKTKFECTASTFWFVLKVGFIIIGGFGILDSFIRTMTQNEIILGFLYFGILFVVCDLLLIPFELYNIFVIEERFGFNRMTAAVFISDKLKAYCLTTILGRFPVSGGFIHI